MDRMRLNRLARVNRVSASAGFDPASVAGLVLNFVASPAYCFSDSAGTTPCAVNDPVGCWKSKSGTYSFTNASAASTSRHFKQDAGGKFYVDFGGGANDGLNNATAPTALNGLTGGLVGLACRPAAQGNSLFEALSFGTGSSNDAFCLLRGNGTATPNEKWEANVTGQGVGVNVDDTVIVAVGSDVRLVARSETVTLQTCRLLRNGTQVGSTARSTALPTTTGACSVANGNSRLYLGRIYGFVVYSADLSDADAARLDGYLTGLMP